MSARTDWIDGWEAGLADAEARSTAVGRDPVRLDFIPAETASPPADPGLHRSAWEDGYTVGMSHAQYPCAAFAKSANPYV